MMLFNRSDSDCGGPSVVVRLWSNAEADRDNCCGSYFWRVTGQNSTKWYV